MMAALAAFGAIGCGGYNGPGALSASTTSLNFGSVGVGQATSQMVTLTNSSEAAIVISGLYAVGSGFTVDAAQATTLFPHMSTSIYVNFTPATKGDANGMLAVTNNSADHDLNVQLVGTGVGHAVELSWGPSASSVIGYNVYRGTVSGGPYARINTVPDPLLFYPDDTVQSGNTYFYVVTSVNSNNVESGYSSEISAAVP